MHFALCSQSQPPKTLLGNAAGSVLCAVATRASGQVARDAAIQHLRHPTSDPVTPCALGAIGYHAPEKNRTKRAMDWTQCQLSLGDHNMGESRCRYRARPFNLFTLCPILVYPLAWILGQLNLTRKSWRARRRPGFSNLLPFPCSASIYWFRIRSSQRAFKHTKA